jgi:hypothetical protein
MKITKVFIENDPTFRVGYQCAIDDLKFIFEQAKIFNPAMDIVSLMEDWEQITGLAQHKICGKLDN